MGATWARRLAAIAAMTLISLSALGEEPKAVPAQAAKPPGPAAPEGKNAAATPVDRSEVGKLRAEAEERLKALGDPADKGAAANKPVREVFEERLVLLKAWEEAAKARREAEHPEAKPERLLADSKAGLEHAKALLEQSEKSPDVLLPASLRNAPRKSDEGAMAELKEAIDEVQNDLKDWSEKLEKLKGDSAQPSSAKLAAIRAERDKAHQLLATLWARRTEREQAASQAKSQADRSLALERLVNYQWEARAQEERLKGLEARMALEAKLSDLSVVQLQEAEVQAQRAKKALAVLQARYRVLAERQEAALKLAAADQERRAAKANDPLERYRAKRSAELLAMEARVKEHKKELATSPFPSLEEMRKGADAADTELAQTKRLLDDGRISHLDALRLNNDFRRIGPEREAIVRRELAAVTQQMTYYENALSGVELALLSDSRDDRIEYESLLERLDKSRHKEAEALCVALEARHTKLLNEQREVLLGLANRAEQTHQEILRRLKLLDDQYGFIRTHLILVRDREPIGTATLVAAGRELSHLSKGIARLSAEACDRGDWGRVSIEFMAAVAAAVILPWPFYRLRRVLDRRGRLLIGSAQ